MNAIEWESQGVDKKSDSTHVAIITMPTFSSSTIMLYLLIKEDSVKLWENLSWIDATPTLSHKDVINRVSIYPI